MASEIQNFDAVVIGAGFSGMHMQVAARQIGTEGASL
jgi:cation diffusion facilitator CzcD-associated flavoprotein CzcO